MIDEHGKAVILRLYYEERWSIRTIARQLGVHSAAIRRVLAKASAAQQAHDAYPSSVV